MKAVVPKRTSETAQGWVLYDGECSLCTGAARRFQNLLFKHGFGLATLQSPWVHRRLGTNAKAPPVEMKLLAEDGRVFGGADALVQVARKIWWAWPLFAIAQVPGAMVLLRAVYRRIAANRHCLDGACSVQKPLTRHHITRVFFEMP